MRLWLAESLVDRQRFSGASYRAANWQAIGWTRGFAKRQGHFVHHGQSKEVYVYVMESRMRRFIHGDDRQPLLTAFLAQRLSEENQSLTKSLRMKKLIKSWKPKLPPQCELSVEDVETVVGELTDSLPYSERPLGGANRNGSSCLNLTAKRSGLKRRNARRSSDCPEVGGPEKTGA